MYRKSGLSIQSFIPLFKKRKKQKKSQVMFSSSQLLRCFTNHGAKIKLRVICITHFYMFNLMSTTIWGYWNSATEVKVLLLVICYLNYIYIYKYLFTHTHTHICVYTYIRMYIIFIPFRLRKHVFYCKDQPLVLTGIFEHDCCNSFHL